MNHIKLIDIEIQRALCFSKFKTQCSKVIPDFTHWYWGLHTYPKLFTNDPVIPSLWLLNEEEKSKHSVTELLEDVSKVALSELKCDDEKKNKLIIQETNKKYILSYGEHKVSILKKTYKRLSKIGISPSLFKKLIFILCFRHKYIGIYNHNMQLSLLPKFMKYLSKSHNGNGEMFASSFNHTLGLYGSVFIDIEFYFGSIGNFFEVKKIKEGLWVLNPPFNVIVMEKMYDVVVEYMKLNPYLTFLITIPVWDHKGQEFLETKYKYSRYSAGDYPDLKLISKLEESEYKVEHKIFRETEINYFNYFSQKVIRNVTATHVFVLSNHKIPKILTPETLSFMM